MCVSAYGYVHVIPDASEARGIGSLWNWSYSQF